MKKSLRKRAANALVARYVEILEDKSTSKYRCRVYANRLMKILERYPSLIETKNMEAAKVAQLQAEKAARELKALVDKKHKAAGDRLRVVNEKVRLGLIHRSHSSSRKAARKPSEDERSERHRGGKKRIAQDDAYRPVSTESRWSGLAP